LVCLGAQTAGPRRVVLGLPGGADRWPALCGVEESIAHPV